MFAELHAIQVDIRTRLDGACLSRTQYCIAAVYICHCFAVLIDVRLPQGSWLKTAPLQQVIYLLIIMCYNLRYRHSY